MDEEDNPTGKAPLCDASASTKRDAAGISESDPALVRLGYMTILALMLVCTAAAVILWTALYQTSVVT